MGEFFKFYAMSQRDKPFIGIVPAWQCDLLQFSEEDYRRLREFVAQNYPAWDQSRPDDKIKAKSWYVEYRCDDTARQVAVTVKGTIPSEDFALLQDLTPDGYSLLVKRAP